MAAGIYTLLVEQGATLSKTFHFKKADGTSFDFTGWTPTAQVRDSAGPSGALRLTLACSFVGDQSDGKINVAATAAETAALIVAGSLVWDLVTTSGAVVRRRVQGVCLVTPRVTQ